MKERLLYKCIKSKDFSFLSSRTGYYPINNLGRWHSGITIELKSEESIFSPISGKILDYCFDENKENYLLLEDKIPFPMKNNKTEELNCYSIFYNFNHHKKIKEFINQEKGIEEIKEYNLNGVLPIGIEPEISSANNELEYVEICNEKKFLNFSFFMNLTHTKVRKNNSSESENVNIKKFVSFSEEKDKSGFLAEEYKTGDFLIKKGTPILWQNSQIIVHGSDNIVYDNLKKQTGYINVSKDNDRTITKYGNILLKDETRFYYVESIHAQEIHGTQLILEKKDIQRLEEIEKEIKGKKYLIKTPSSGGDIVDFKKLPKSYVEYKLVRFIDEMKRELLNEPEVKVFGCESLESNTTFYMGSNYHMPQKNCTYRLMDEKGNLSFVENPHLLAKDVFDELKKELKLKKDYSSYKLLKLKKKNLDKNVSGLKIINNGKEVNDGSLTNKTGVFNCRPFLFDSEGTYEYKFNANESIKEHVYISYKIINFGSMKTKKTNGFIIYLDKSLLNPIKFCNNVSELKNKEILNFDELFSKSDEDVICALPDGYTSVNKKILKIKAKNNISELKGKSISPNVQIGFANEETVEEDGIFCVEWGLFFDKDITSLDIEKKILKLPEKTPCKEIVRHYVEMGFPKDTIINLSDDLITSLKVEVCFYISGNNYDNSSGVEFNEKKNKCKINKKIENIILYNHSVGIVSKTENDDVILKISYIHKDIDTQQYRDFIEKIILVKLVEQEYNCSTHKDKTGRVYYIISFLVEPVFIAQQYKIELPLNVSKEDEKTLAAKMDTDFLISKVLYGVEEQFDSETPSEYENKNFKMETNNRIEIDNRIFAFTDKELEQFITEPIKEYLQGLVPMNFGNKKITSALNEDDFKCDMKTLKNDLIKYKSELKECLDFGIKGAGSNYLYADADPYDNYYYGSKYMDAIKYLYNTISLHPLEFVKAAREETYNVGIEDIPSEVDLEPVVKEINKETNKFYFVYPPFFYKMVEECGLKEYNPYEQTGIKSYTIDGITYDIKNNPGFILSNSYVFTQSFNYPYKPDAYCHEGVDIAISYNNCGKIPIISGIHGKVILEGDKKNKSYGCFIVIKADTKFEEKYTRYYLLGHLDRTKPYKHEKQYIFPGEIVGYVGNTGHCKGRDANGVLWDLDGNNESSAKTKARNDGVGSHLHLQLYLSTLSETNFLSEAESGLAKHKNDEIAIVIKNKGIVNPFNYYEKYIRDTKK